MGRYAVFDGMLRRAQERMRECTEIKRDREREREGEREWESERERASDL